MNAVEVQDLSHTFKTKNKSTPTRTALKNISLSVHQGEIFGFLGPNGGGKTTLFRILSTLISPTQGRVFLFGQDALAAPEKVRGSMGVVFQNPSLDKKLTVGENLSHQGHLYGLKGDFLQKKIDQRLQWLSLQDRKGDLVEHLSGGQQRRVEIAKGLLHEPKLLILDEPSTGLDIGARRDLWRTLVELKKQGITILITTHLMEEGDQCDRLLILHHGEIISLGNPAELKDKIGGDVITIHSSQLDKLQQGIKEKFLVEPLRVGETLKIEKKEGHKFIPPLVEAFPGAIEAITIGKPTLEDVFIKLTGETFFKENGIA